MVIREPRLSSRAGRYRTRAGRARPWSPAGPAGVPAAGRRNPGSVSWTLTTPAAPSPPTPAAPWRASVAPSRGRPVLGVGGRRLGRGHLALDHVQLQIRPVRLLVVVAVVGREGRGEDVLVDALAEPAAHGLGRVAAEGATGLAGGDASGVHVLGVDLGRGEEGQPLLGV